MMKRENNSINNNTQTTAVINTIRISKKRLNNNINNNAYQTITIIPKQTPKQE